MKTLLLKGPRLLELAELERLELDPRQVRVRVRKVGVCGSDYSSIAGKLPFTRFPIVPGHEASGDVVEAGRDTDWRVNERVLIHPILVDRQDPTFIRGDVHHSESAEVLGVVSRNGTYAEEVIVEDYMLRLIPAGMDYESAAMVEPVAVAVRAVKEGMPRSGDRVLVFGAGNIGLLVVQVARALGVGTVVVTDLSSDRLHLARQLGVDEAVDVGYGFPTSRLEKQFDIVIDGIGSDQTVKNALACCARGGRIVVYGVPYGDITFPLRVAFSKDVRLITSRLYNADFGTAIQMVSEGKVRVKELITHRIRLKDAPAVLLRVLDGQESAVKIMITP